MRNNPTSIGMNEIYRVYKKTCIDPVDYTTFSNVIKEFNLGIIDKVNKGLIWDIPFNIGHFGVTKRKPKYEFNDDGKLDFKKSTVKTDWGATKRLWKEEPETKGKIYLVYENEHTNGYSYRYKWRKKNWGFRNLHLYEFKPCRSMSRSLGHYLQDNPNTEYYDF